VSMFTEAGIILGVMVAVYAAARAFKLATELAMVAAALGAPSRAATGFRPGRWRKAPRRTSTSTSSSSPPRSS